MNKPTSIPPRFGFNQEQMDYIYSLSMHACCGAWIYPGQDGRGEAEKYYYNPIDLSDDELFPLIEKLVWLAIYGENTAWEAPILTGYDDDFAKECEKIIKNYKLKNNNNA